MTSSVPPGWYPDPVKPDETAKRWWNGTRWTTRVLSASDDPNAPEQPMSAWPERRTNLGLRIVSHVLELATIVLVIYDNSLGLTIVGSVVTIATLVIEIVVVLDNRRAGTLRPVAVVLHLLVGAGATIFFAYVWVHAIIFAIAHQ